MYYIFSTRYSGIFVAFLLGGMIACDMWNMIEDLSISPVRRNFMHNDVSSPDAREEFWCEKLAGNYFRIFFGGDQNFLRALGFVTSLYIRLLHSLYMSYSHVYRCAQ